jgi:hypothetical protein
LDGFLFGFRPPPEGCVKPKPKPRVYSTSGCYEVRFFKKQSAYSNTFSR